MGLCFAQPSLQAARLAQAARTWTRLHLLRGAETPPAVAPGRQRVAVLADVRRRIEAVRAPWVAAADAGDRQPATTPGAVDLDSLQRVFRAGRQMAALPAEPRLERPPVGDDRCFRDRLGRPS